MKKTVYNAICIILTIAFFACLGFIASASYTPDPDPDPDHHTVVTDPEQVLSIWSQSVKAEYSKHNIVYRGEYDVQ